MHRFLPQLPLLLVVLGVKLSTAAFASPLPPDAPNIIVLVAEDLPVRAIGAYGSDFVKTPNLDRLAEEGLRFDAAYVANPLANSSRATLLTGLHSHSHGVRVAADTLDPDRLTVASHLRRAGYATALAGPWTAGSEPSGFSERLAAKESQAPVEIVEQTLDWLEQRSAEDLPAMLFIDLGAPGRSLRGAAYGESTESLPEPPTLYDDYRRGRPAAYAATQRIRDLELPPTVPTPAFEGDDLLRWKYQWLLGAFAQRVRELDHAVGLLMAGLKTQNLAEDTLVLLISDRGLFLGEHGWYGGGLPYEESLRVPLLLRWPPRIEAGGARQALVQNIDIAPTLLQVAGLGIPESLHGLSLSTLFAEDDEQYRVALYFHYYDDETAEGVASYYGMTTGRFKLIRYYQDPEHWEFYDRRYDPLELTNAYSIPEWVTLADVSRKRLKLLLDEYEDQPETGEVDRDRLGRPPTESGH